MLAGGHAWPQISTTVPCNSSETHSTTPHLRVMPQSEPPADSRCCSKPPSTRAPSADRRSGLCLQLGGLGRRWTPARARVCRLRPRTVSQPIPTPVLCGLEGECDLRELFRLKGGPVRAPRGQVRSLTMPERAPSGLTADRRLRWRHRGFGEHSSGAVRSNSPEAASGRGAQPSVWPVMGAAHAP